MLLWLAACGVSSSPPVAFHVTPHKPDIQIQIDANPERAVIEVLSPSGIGSADFVLTSRALPKQIVLRLHLRGLEWLRFTYDKGTVSTSVASTQGNAVNQYYRDAGSEAAPGQTLAPGSPYWMTINLVTPGTSPQTIPLQDGYIQVEVPADFIRGQHRQFSLQWIDFYR